MLVCAFIIVLIVILYNTPSMYVSFTVKQCVMFYPQQPHHWLRHYLMYHFPLAYFSCMLFGSSMLWEKEVWLWMPFIGAAYIWILHLQLLPLFEDGWSSWRKNITEGGLSELMSSSPSLLMDQDVSSQLLFLLSCLPCAAMINAYWSM